MKVQVPLDPLTAFKNFRSNKMTARPISRTPTKVSTECESPVKGSRSRLRIKSAVEMVEIKPQQQKQDAQSPKATEHTFSQEVDRLTEFAQSIQDDMLVTIFEAFQCEVKKLTFHNRNNGIAEVNKLASLIPLFIESQSVEDMLSIIQCYDNLKTLVGRNTQQYYHTTGLALSEFLLREMVRHHGDKREGFIAEHMIYNMINLMRPEEIRMAIPEEIQENTPDCKLTHKNEKVQAINSIAFSMMSLQYKAVSVRLHSFKEIFNRMVSAAKYKPSPNDKAQPEYWIKLIELFVGLMPREKDRNHYLKIANQEISGKTNIFASDSFQTIYTGDTEGVLEVKVLLEHYIQSGYDNEKTLATILEKVSNFSADDPAAPLLKESLAEELLDHMISKEDDMHQQLSEQIDALSIDADGTVMLKSLISKDILSRYDSQQWAGAHGMSRVLSALLDLKLHSVQNDPLQIAYYDLVKPFAHNYLLDEKSTQEPIHDATLNSLQRCFELKPDTFKDVVIKYIEDIDFGDQPTLKSEAAKRFVNSIPELDDYIIEEKDVEEEEVVDLGDSADNSQQPLLDQDQADAEESQIDGAYRKMLADEFSHVDSWRTALEQMKVAFDRRKDISDEDFQKHMVCLRNAKKLSEGETHHNSAQIIAGFYAMRDFYNKGASPLLKAVAITLAVIFAAMLVAGVACLAYALSPAAAASIPTSLVNAATSVVPAKHTLEAGIALTTVGGVGSVFCGLFAHSKSTTAPAETLDKLAKEHAAFLPKAAAAA